MDRSALRWTHGRKVDDKQLRDLKKMGGVGAKYDKAGRVRQVVDIMHTGEKNILAKFENPKPKFKKKTPIQKEAQQALENVLAFETSGHHRYVKPSAKKRAEKRYKDFVDSGRPLPGVDV